MADKEDKDFKTEYLRDDLLFGRGVTPAPLAILQMLDPMGKKDPDRHREIAALLLRDAYRRYPELLDRPSDYAPAREGAYSRTEDLNSVGIKFKNWRLRRQGEELTPREKVTEAFIDVRNPDSWW